MPLPEPMLTLHDVAAILNVKYAQVYAIVRRDELRSAKIGGRGIWRVATDDLEAYVDRCYADTQTWIERHPFDEARDAIDAG